MICNNEFFNDQVHEDPFAHTSNQVNGCEFKAINRHAKCRTYENSIALQIQQHCKAK